MKKIIISGLVLATFLTPSVSFAQVVQEDLQVQLETLKQQLIELLMAQIATLQSQIEQLIAEQAQTNVRVAQVEAEPVNQQVTLGGVPKPLPYEFTPVVELGGTNPNGLVHPELKEYLKRAGCTGCDTTDVSWIYITMPTDMTEGNIGFNTTGDTSFIPYGRIKSGINIDSGFAPGKTYTWVIRAKSADTSFSTRTGTFTMLDY